VGVQTYKGRAGRLIPAVSIPILRVGVQPKNANEYDWSWYVSIPILRVGVQIIKSYFLTEFFPVSIPILRVGVQLPQPCRCGGIAVSIPILRVGVQFVDGGNMITYPRFQFPYCAWEFKCEYCGSDVLSVPSIPILRVGVQLTDACFENYKKAFNSHTARGSSIPLCANERRS